MNVIQNRVVRTKLDIYVFIMYIEQYKSMVLLPERKTKIKYTFKYFYTTKYKYLLHNDFI